MSLSAGNFFSQVEISAGNNDILVEAEDGSGTASQSLNLTGKVSQIPSYEIDYLSLVDLTDQFVADYTVTSFNSQSNILYAGLELTTDAFRGLTGPILVGVRNISDLDVTLHSPDGVTADGMAYYEVSDISVDPISKAITGASLDLAFENPEGVRFQYDLVILGKINQPPRFTSLPAVEAVEGQDYSYTPAAVDPEEGEVEITLASKPGGMSLNDGVITWDTTGKSGDHVVVVRATDVHGAFKDQTFTVSVENTDNTPPSVFFDTDSRRICRQ